jgi:dihydrofolate synthase/folylpolyglutamate synthase
VLRDELDGLVFDLETPKSVYRRLEIKLMGAHQFDNAAAAVGAVEALSLYGVNISREAVYSGLRDARWPGRLEILRKEPTVLIDGAHNIAGVKTLVHALEKYFYGRRKILVMGVLKDKDYEDMIGQILPHVDTAIATLPDSPRALPAGQLAEAMARISQQVSRWGDRAGFRERCVGETDSISYKINIFSRDKIADAVNLAFELALPEDVIVFAGSLYMIGSVRTLLK